jgi:hypothetical protein
VPFKSVIIKGFGKVKFPASMSDEAIEQSIKNLDMSEAARMARAKDQGFGERIYYHGTQKDFGEFSEVGPHFFAKTPNLANQFSKMRGDGLGGNVIQSRIKIENMFDYTNDDHIKKIEKFLRDNGDLYDTDVRGNVINRIDGIRNGEFSAIEDEKVIDAIKNTGFDAFSVSETAEPIRYAKADRSRSVFSDRDMAKDKYNEVMERWKKYGMGNESIKPRVRTDKDRFIIEYQGDTFNQVGDDLGLFGKNVAVFNPSNIRSKYASFNPDLKDSPSLLASSAPLMLGAGAMLKGEEAEAGAVTNSIKNALSKLHPDIKFSISGNDTIVLDKVIVPDSKRGSGQGTKFMEDFLSLVDKEGKQAALTPTSDLGGNKTRLKKFYKRFGFVDNKGKNKDYSVMETMIRPSKGVAAVSPLLLGGLLGADQAQAATGTMTGPKHPKIADLKAFIDKHDDILMDDMLGGVTSYLDKLSYEDKITMKDRLLLALDLI